MRDLKKDLDKLKDPEKAEFYPKFFKDKDLIFIGVTIPNCRKVALKFRNLLLEKVLDLLRSNIHEERIVGLMILVAKFKKEPDKIYKIYLKNTKYINNWDLVDLSCYKVIGEYLLNNNRSVLYKLVKSKNIWERRIAIVSTMAFIRKGELDDTFKIAEILLSDKEDLIQKAVGWLIREAGKKDQRALLDFLRKNYKNMSRITLRYAIERFPKDVRTHYLQGIF